MRRLMATPLHAQIRGQLLQRLEAQLPPGNRLPCEEALAEELGVSRATIREALMAMEHEGILTRKHGIGTFVHPTALRNRARVELETSFGDLLLELGYTRVHAAGSRTLEPASPFQAGLLAVPEGSELALFERTFYADGRPAIFSFNRIPLALLNGPDAPDPDHQDSIFAFIARHTGAEVTHRIAWFRARRASESVAARLELDVGEPVLCWDEVLYSIEDRPVCSCEIFFDTDLVPLCTMRRTGLPELRRVVRGKS